MSKTTLKTDREEKYALNLGRWIHDSREAVGMNACQLAREIDVHRNTIWRWESGNAIPSAYQLDLIAGAVKRAAVVR